MEQEKEARQLGDILAEVRLTASTPTPSSIQELGTIYSDIELTPEESAMALADARQKKHFLIQERAREARVAELRRYLTQPWTSDQIRQWIEGKRIPALFPDEKILFADSWHEGKPGNNAGSVFNLLCLYFSNDPAFFEAAQKMEVKRPDLRKGILLAGGVGRGKTTLMQLFQRNPRQVFMIKNAKDIAMKWRASAERGGEYLDTLATAYELPVNDAQNFFHRSAGLCIDDFGTEDVQNSFGNRASVMGDLIELRYYNGAVGPMLHLTTNLSTKTIKEYYGDRVSSRLRETMNVIEYIGEDLRK